MPSPAHAPCEARATMSIGKVTWIKNRADIILPSLKGMTARRTKATFIGFRRCRCNCCTFVSLRDDIHAHNPVVIVPCRCYIARQAKTTPSFTTRLRPQAPEQHSRRPPDPGRKEIIRALSTSLMQRDAESLGDARRQCVSRGRKLHDNKVPVAGQHACNWTDDRRGYEKGTVAFRIGS